MQFMPPGPMPGPLNDFEKRKDALVLALRELGLYEDQVFVAYPQDPNRMDEPPNFDPEEGGPMPRIMGRFDLGNVAFSKRVQNPEEHDIDMEFREMTSEIRRDGWQQTASDAVAELDRLMGNDDDDA